MQLLDAPDGPPRRGRLQADLEGGLAAAAALPLLRRDRDPLRAPALQELNSIH